MNKEQAEVLYYLNKMVEYNVDTVDNIITRAIELSYPTSTLRKQDRTDYVLARALERLWKIVQHNGEIDD